MRGEADILGVGEPDPPPHPELARLAMANNGANLESLLNCPISKTYPRVASRGLVAHRLRLDPSYTAGSRRDQIRDDWLLPTGPRVAPGPALSKRPAAGRCRGTSVPAGTPQKSPAFRQSSP